LEALETQRAGLRARPKGLSKDQKLKSFITRTQGSFYNQELKQHWFGLWRPNLKRGGLLRNSRCQFLNEILIGINRLKLVDIVSQQYEIPVHKLQLLFSVAHLSARSPTHSKYPLSWRSWGGGGGGVHTHKKGGKKTAKKKTSIFFSQ